MNNKRPKRLVASGIDFRVGNWPSAKQKLWLRGALVDGHECIKAWEAWSFHIDLDDVEYDAFRMLPLVYSNLASHGCDHPEMARLKGIARRTWYKNQILIQRLSDVLKLFNDAGIRTLTFKGAPLLIRYYRKEGKRTMHDLDILIAPSDVHRSVDLLESHGWRLMFPEYAQSPDRYLDENHSVHFRDEKDVELDVHWFALLHCRFRDADQSFWDHAVPIRIRDTDTLTLDVTNNLVHGCTHGVATHNTCPMRWVADALTLIESPEIIDWNRLVLEVARRRVVKPVRDALVYLHTRFNAPIPSSIIDNLSGLKVRKREYWEYWAKTRACGTYRHAFLISVNEYCRESEANNKSASIGGYVRYMKNIWRVESTGKTVALLIRKIVRGVSRSIAGRFRSSSYSDDESLNS